jgi:transporter family-2 protein
MGIMMSIYLPMNSAVSRYLGSPITANITFFFIALISSILIFAIWGEFETIKSMKNVPLWLYLTGVASAFIVLGMTYLIPKVGVRKYFILCIAGQIAMAMIVSHFGVFESSRDPITMKKIFGAVLLFSGVIVSTS